MNSLTLILLTIAILGGAITVAKTLEASRLKTALDTARRQELELVRELSSANKELELLTARLLSSEEQQSVQAKEQEERLRQLAREIVHDGNKLLREEHTEHLNTLLLPFREKLQSFEKEVREHKHSGIQQFASMETLVKALSEQHSEMNASARNLADALRSEQKTQGNWGELALERIFEISGLKEGIEYRKQLSLKNDDNALQRPDFIVLLPADKHIVIDSKVSLTAFERYVNTSDPAERKEQLKLHIASLNNHIRQLGSKNYADLPGLRTPEFVLLFIPLEASFALAVQSEPDIYARAWEKRIILVTPSTLLATLKTIESIWKQERQTRNAEQIAEEAGKLYDKFVGFVEDLQQVEKHQLQAQKSFSDAFNKLREGKGNIVRRVENLRQLGAKTSKRLGIEGEEDTPVDE